MQIFIFIGDIFTRAFDGEAYPIIILALTLFLIISYFKRILLKDSEEELYKTIDINNKLLFDKENVINEYKKKLGIAESDIKNQNTKIESLNNQNNTFKKNEIGYNDRIKLLQDKYSSIYREYNLHKNTSKNETSKLRSFQISPHFLKNLLNKAFLESEISLNNNLKHSFSLFGRKYFSLKKIQKGIDIHNKTLTELLLLLTDILEYFLYGIQAPKVHIDIELDKLNKFCRLIELNKGIRIIFDKSINNHHIYIPPTILFNYIDNAIKHGYFNKNNTINIKLQIDNNKLEYIVTTPLHPKMDSSKAIGGNGTEDFKKCFEYYENSDYLVTSEVIENKHIAKLNITL